MSTLTKIWGPGGEFLGTIGDTASGIVPSDGMIGCLGTIFAPFFLVGALIFICTLPSSCAADKAKEAAQEQQYAVYVAQQQAAATAAAQQAAVEAANAYKPSLDEAKKRRMNLKTVTHMREMDGLGYDLAFENVKVIPEEDAVATARYFLPTDKEWDHWGNTPKMYTDGKHYYATFMFNDGGRNSKKEFVYETIALRVDIP